MKELQDRIGYAFRDPSLLALALTTPACRMDRSSEVDNQRLEFLGDAVIGLLSADAIYRAHPDEPEGALTVRRTHLVSTASLAAAAERLGLRSLLKRNAGAHELPPLAKPLTDAMEAVVGAAWLDGGLDAARAVYARMELPDERGRFDEWTGNPKGYLQIKAQELHPPECPTYTIDAVEGPQHAPSFTATVNVRAFGSATAKGPTRHGAEAAAAAELLRRTFGGNV